ncbi:MAG: hypothetical protein FJY66_03295 [Calditrichaeota bacterium]|nr:hypothetical protein [Calditrichota bacterium]
MRSRRGDDEAPVSLFSFQDIITSVSGVLIFLVLMFVLQLSRQSATKSRTAPPERPSKPDFYPDRMREILFYQAYLDNLKLKSVTMDRFTDQQKADWARVNRLKNEINDLNATNTLLSTSYTNAVKELEERDIYAQIERGAKEPIVVLCSGGEILCGKLLTPPQRFDGPRKEDTFLTYLSRLPAYANQPYLFLLRPSSATYAWPLVEQVKAGGSNVGWQPWLEDKPFRFHGGEP